MNPLSLLNMFVSDSRRKSRCSIPIAQCITNDVFSLVSQDVMKRATSRFAANFYNEKISGDYHKFLYNFAAEGAFETYEKELNTHLYRVRCHHGGQHVANASNVAQSLTAGAIFNRTLLSGRAVFFCGYNHSTFCDPHVDIQSSIPGWL